MYHILLCRLCIVFSVVACSVKANTAVKFLVWADDLAPILYLEPQTKDYKGIVAEIFSAIDIPVIFSKFNRNRGEDALYMGEMDVTILSREWLKHPDKLVYSVPIYVHKDFLYATHPISDQPLVDLLRDKLICTRRGYVYPKIDYLFKDKVSQRIDSHIENSQFEMLLRERCDFLVTNEFVGQWIIAKNNWGKDIYRSKFPIDEVDFTFAIHPRNTIFLDLLNQHINQLKQSGELQKIINQQRQFISKKD
jgi:polar amino acid transport system substrate-binding protein